MTSSGLSERVVPWVVAALMLAVPLNTSAAETVDSPARTKTQIILKVDSEQPVPMRASFQERPPAITIEFPSRQVMSSLPEQSTVASGAVQTITARYDPSPASGPLSGRIIQSLSIGLRARYPFRAWSEPGRVIVEVSHPGSVGSTAVEVGLKRGTIVSGIGKGLVTERFQAMQAALAQAAPSHWRKLQSSEQAAMSSPSASPLMIGRLTPTPKSASTSSPARQPRAIAPRPSTSWFPMAGIGLALLIAGAAWWIFQSGFLDRLFSSSSSGGPSPRLPPGVVLIDQLVWRAFERQGYQLVLETELRQPPLGTLRVVMKDSVKSALLFVGHGPFFEKQTVERFIRAMRQVSVQQGMLVASGSFTVPAQRFAKSHQVSLIGREQLIELLSAGAGSEYFTKQLEQQQAKLEEAKETLRQYAEELDTLRRQRNEASWFLGEERARAETLAASLDETSQRLRTFEVELQRWEKEASASRKRWEESEWYLGEARERNSFFEQQLSELQELAKQLEKAERARAEANWYLGEERSKVEALTAKLQNFQALRRGGGRREANRVRIPEALIELRNGKPEPLFSGSPRDVSRTGFGLETDQALPDDSNLRALLLTPGRDPIESTVAVVWQRSSGDPERYQSGCRFIEPPTEVAALIDHVIEQTSD
jgi:hypothetical protein